MHDDEIVKETRRLRDQYAKQFNYDLDLIFRDLQQKQQQSERKYLSFSDAKDETKKSDNAKELG